MSSSTFSENGNEFMNFDAPDNDVTSVFKSMNTSNPWRGLKSSPRMELIIRYFGFNNPVIGPIEYCLFPI
jgi:hypothetical protein